MGALAKLTMTWRTKHGDVPRIGHFLRNDGPRTRTAFEICRMRLVKSSTAGNVVKFVAECQRWPVNDIPDGATVHLMHWNKRTRRRA